MMRLVSWSTPLGYAHRRKTGETGCARCMRMGEISATLQSKSVEGFEWLIVGRKAKSCGA